MQIFFQPAVNLKHAVFLSSSLLEEEALQRKLKAKLTHNITIEYPLSEHPSIPKFPCRSFLKFFFGCSTQMRHCYRVHPLILTETVSIPELLTDTHIFPVRGNVSAFVT